MSKSDERDDAMLVIAREVGESLTFYTRRHSSCSGVGCLYSPESLTLVSSSGFAQLSPTCNLNELEYIPKFNEVAERNAWRFEQRLRRL